MTTNLRTLFTVLAILLSGGLFGFFFTMAFAIMPGFDQTPAYSALIANQMIGRATQQSYFILLLLGAPAAILISMAISGYSKAYSSLVWLALALAMWGGMLAITLLLNVPLNHELDGMALSQEMKGADEIWLKFSTEWKYWNIFRVVFCAVSTLFATFGLIRQYK